MKVIDILKISEAFTYLADKELDLNTAYIIADNLKKINTANEIITAKRKKLVDACGDKDKNGNLVITENGEVPMSDANKLKFIEASEELNNSDIDIKGLVPILKKKLYDTNMTIPAKYILFLSDYLQEDNDSKKED